MDKVDLLQGAAHVIPLLGLAWGVGRPELSRMRAGQSRSPWPDDLLTLFPNSCPSAHILNPCESVTLKEEPMTSGFSHLVD